VKVDALFKKKAQPARIKPGGLSKEQESSIRDEFLTAMDPLGERATSYFRHFEVNGKHRFWLLPACETYADLPIEKMQAVLRFRAWFVAEIKKHQMDELQM
jgi:hypothetical protein